MIITPAQQGLIELIHLRLESGIEPTATELARDLEVSRDSVCRHLRALARAGIVRTRKSACRRWLRVAALTGCRLVPVLVTDAEATRAAEALDAAGLPHLAARLRGGA